MGLDAMLVEINPLVLTEDGRVVALDAKVSIDNNAVGRHPELEDLGTSPPRTPERMARERASPT